jgi:hypothetical protein
VQSVECRVQSGSQEASLAMRPCMMPLNRVVLLLIMLLIMLLLSPPGSRSGSRDGSWEASTALRPCIMPMNLTFRAADCKSALRGRFMGSTVTGLRPVCVASNFEVQSDTQSARTPFLQPVRILEHRDELLGSFHGLAVVHHGHEPRTSSFQAASKSKSKSKSKNRFMGSVHGLSAVQNVLEPPGAPASLPARESHRDRHLPARMPALPDEHGSWNVHLPTINHRPSTINAFMAIDRSGGGGSGRQ